MSLDTKFQVGSEQQITLPGTPVSIYEFDYGLSSKFACKISSAIIGTSFPAFYSAPWF